jgi:hypothetical protein
MTENLDIVLEKLENFRNECLLMGNSTSEEKNWIRRNYTSAKRHVGVIYERGFVVNDNLLENG